MGGKRGHSNMDHWLTTAEVKDYARKRRRLDAKDIIARETAEMAAEAPVDCPFRGSAMDRE